MSELTNIASLEYLKEYDPAVGEAMDKELKRQRRNLELIASENIVTPAVMAAMGSHLTNKYAEGYPGKRYYGGCECVDIVEEIARQRACELFGAEHANVQPHSGAQANMAVYFAMLNPGDTVMGMNLNEGGHLTHGSPVNMSGKYFNFVPYGVDSVTHRIDYDKVLEIAKECKPKLIVAGASAYPRIIDFPRLRAIADEVGAYLMVDMAHIAGLVAAGVHPNPVPYCEFVTTTTHKTLRGPRGGMILCREEFAKAIDKAIFPGTQGGPLMHTIVSGGTDNHVLLLDLRDSDVTGKELEARLDDCYITVNKNTIPGEPRSPFVTSGVRIGTAAVTTRGLGVEEMDLIAEYITMVLNDYENSKETVRAGVEAICKKYPLYE